MGDQNELYYASKAPRFYIEGANKEELLRDTVQLDVSEDIHGMRRAALLLTAIGPKTGQKSETLLYMDGAVIDFGKKLEVAVGPPNAPRTVFSGYISGIEACFEQGRDPQLRVFAEDKLMDLRMTRRMKTYEKVSDADLLQAIAKEHGLTAQADVDGPTHDMVQQWNQSDLAFLRERAQRLAAEIWLDDTVLHMATRDKRSGTAIKLIQGADLLSLEARADLAHQRSSVFSGGYDADKRDSIDEEGGSSLVDAEAKGGGKTGVSILKRAFGERKSFRLRDVPLDDAEARDLAKADMLRRARGFVTLRGVTNGTPDMMVGSSVKLERVGPMFEGGGYRVIEVMHGYSLAHGYRTEFMAERPDIGRTS
jgi:phage protein D